MADYRLNLTAMAVLLFSSDLALAQERPADGPLEVIQGGDWLYGSVTQIDEEGNLILDTGNVIDLWGLSLDVGSNIDELMLQHSLFCRVLRASDYVKIADCSMVPGRARSSSADAMLSLFHWLPELKLATQSCSAQDAEVVHPGFLHATEVFYSCDQHKQPIRQWMTE